ncbi:unnamed protein product [Rotaria sordida]|uniref:PiggyBac transposable element-derived protein domain-containing protein n=1 Tax=Rotaria sordida TaxID=392033 RepID=A0A814U6F1_9BILA|nr:unnamed protein product [Rotaria sordida]CAF1420165.1 unnamed protein product [Rotaria sordida]
MTSNGNLKRSREMSTSNSTNEFDNISEDDESNPDTDYNISGIESDDTSTDEFISQNEDSSDSYASDDDLSDSHVNDHNDMFKHAQPDFIEKNGVSWSSQKTQAAGRLRTMNILNRKPGSITSIQTIVDAFRLFITEDILNEIVMQTNKYAKRFIDQENQRRLNNRNNHKQPVKWKQLDYIELEAFLGLLIQAGAEFSHHQSLVELWDISRSRPIYHATMSLERFKNLLRFLRFDDRQRRDKSDRLAPIRYVFQSFTKQLPQHFIPSENITVDEQLVPFRGRCCFVQYMPKKPAKYGLKFWTLCDVKIRYVLALELCTGKVGNTVQRNISTNIVLHLVDQLPKNVQQGRNITFDRYFSDFNLVQNLLERKMTSLGVVNHKRSFVPNELKLIRQDLYSSWFYFSGQSTILSYQAKEKKPPVILLSTLHDFAEVFDNEKKLPTMIHDYNQTKFGVDVIDQCINNYTCRRITCRWPMIVFFNMIDIAAMNSLNIWLDQNPDWNIGKTYIRRLFLEELCKSLTDSHNQRRVKQSRPRPKVKLALQSLGYEFKPQNLIVQDNLDHFITIKKRCFLCPSHPGRKVRQICDACQRNVCNSHSFSIKSVICQSCKKNTSSKWNLINEQIEEIYKQELK